TCSRSCGPGSRSWTACSRRRGGAGRTLTRPEWLPRIHPRKPPPSLSAYRPQSPRLFDAFERVLAAALEPVARAGSQILHRRRAEHFAGCGSGLNARREIDRHADDVVVGGLALARVQARADLDPESSQPVPKMDRTVERTRWRAEASEQTVPRALDHQAPA